jgi:hypothetical protein
MKNHPLLLNDKSTNFSKSLFFYISRLYLFFELLIWFDLRLDACLPQAGFWIDD